MDNTPYITGNGARISVIFTVSSNNKTKTVAIKEGDYIPSLTYKDTEIKTVSGKVKAIHFTTKKQPRILPKKNYLESIDPNEVITVSHIVIDCSSQNTADLRVIDVDTIIDITSLSLEDIDIKDVKYLSEAAVSFVSDVKPVAVIWNNECVIPEIYDESTNTYWIEITTMNRVNVLTTFTTTTRGIVNIKGHEPNPVYELEFNTEFKNVMDRFTTKMINNEEPTVNDLFVKVSDNVGNPSTVSIGNVGKNIYKYNTITVNKDSNFKWDKNLRELKVLAPDMYMDYAIRREKVSIGLEPNDFSFDFNINLPMEKLQIGDITAVSNNDEKHTYTVEDNKIVENRTSLSSMISTTIKREDGSALPEGLPVFIQKSNSDTIMMTTTDNLSVILTPNIGEGYATSKHISSVITHIVVYGIGAIRISTSCIDEPPVRKTEYHLGNETPDFTSLYEAMHNLQDGDTLILEDGVYDCEESPIIPVIFGISIKGNGADVYFKKPINISSTSGTVELHNIKFKNLNSSEGDFNGYVINTNNGCNVVLNRISISNCTNHFNICQFRNTGFVVVQDSSFINDTCFNILNFGYGYDVSQNGITITGCSFGKCSGKPIEIGNVSGQASIRIEDCTFEERKEPPHYRHHHRLPVHRVIHPVSGVICVDRTGQHNCAYVPYFCCPHCETSNSTEDDEPTTDNNDTPTDNTPDNNDTPTDNTPNTEDTPQNNTENQTEGNNTEQSSGTQE